MFSQPLTRPASPEQLDRMLRVVPSLAWPGLAVLGAVILMGLLWGLFATVPVRVQAQGILLTPAGVADIVAPDNGRLLRVFAQPGDRVRAGQVVAEIDQPEIVADLSKKRLEQAEMQDRYSRIQAFLHGEGAAREGLSSTRVAGLRDRVVALAELAKTIDVMAATQERLAAQGLTTRPRVIDAHRQQLEARTQLMDAQGQLAQIGADTVEDKIKADRERLDLETALAGGQRDIDWLTQELARRSKIVAPTDGVVVELAVNPGEMVSPNGPVMRILPGDGTTLVALLYVPPKNGRAVQVGMKAQIIPSTVNIQRDGFIEGEVISVSPIAATPEGMQRVLKNSTLVSKLTENGAPSQVIVRLETNPRTLSGYRWSTGQGPAMRINNGAMAEGRIVTEDVRLLALIVPQIDRVLGRAGP